MAERFYQHLLSLYIDADYMTVPTRSSHTLFWTTLRTLKWPLLSAVAPRLSLTAFNFCQPFLLQRAIDLSQQPININSTNTGYGLIGAYFLVYTGIAVCPSIRNLASLTHVDYNWSISTLDLSSHHYGPRWPYLHVIWQDSGTRC
jgi:hypothetical protein